MGKAKQLKLIRKLANQLQPVPTEDAFVNHHRQMKKLYNQYGVDGVMGYAKAAVKYGKSK